MLTMVSVSSFAQSATSQVVENLLGTSGWSISRQANTDTYGTYIDGFLMDREFHHLAHTNDTSRYCFPSPENTIHLIQNVDAGKVRLYRSPTDFTEYKTLIPAGQSEFPRISLAVGWWHESSIGASFASPLTRAGNTLSVVCSLIENLNVTARDDGSYTMSTFRNAPGDEELTFSAVNGRTGEVIRLANGDGESYGNTITFRGNPNGSTSYSHVRVRAEPTGVGEYIVFSVTNENSPVISRDGPKPPVPGYEIISHSHNKFRWVHSSHTTTPAEVLEMAIYDQDDRQAKPGTNNITLGSVDTGRSNSFIAAGGSIATIDSWGGGRAGVYEATFNDLEDYQSFQLYVYKGETSAPRTPIMLNGIALEVNYLAEFNITTPGGWTNRQEVKLTLPVGVSHEDITNLRHSARVDEYSGPFSIRTNSENVPDDTSFSQTTENGRDVLQNTLNVTWGSDFLDDSSTYTIHYTMNGRDYEVSYEIEDDGGINTRRIGDSHAGLITIDGREQRTRANLGYVSPIRSDASVNNIHAIIHYRNVNN